MLLYHTHYQIRAGQFDEFTKKKNEFILFRWRSILFLTPSRMILHTGIALSVTLIVIAGVLGSLQYRDKVCCVLEKDLTNI